MSWNKGKSKQRIKDRDFATSEVIVSKLSRERDFTNILPKEAVETDSVHSYVELGGFKEVVSEAKEDQTKQKKALRALNVFQKTADHLLSNKDETTVIQYQSDRVHALTFKPYDDEAARTLNAVIHGIDFVSAMRSFNQIFKEELSSSFFGRVGIADGKTFIVNVGKRGNRDLLSLGGPASFAAKHVTGIDQVTITEKMYGQLPVTLRDLFKPANHRGRSVYALTGFVWQDNADLKNKFSPDFNEEKLQKKIQEFKDEVNLDDIEISGANEKIDFETLSHCNVKRLDSISVYADLDGFTAYMDALKTIDDVKQMVRVFHAIRSEFEEVLTCDFDGIKVQQRGDCILGNVHVPSNDGDESDRTQETADCSVALMSSMKALNDYFGHGYQFDLQIGVASGKVFFARIGKHGERTPITIGHSVDRAESLQQMAEKNDIRLCPKTFDRLPDDLLKEQFKKVDGDDCYSAKGLTVDKLVALEDKKLEKAAHDRVAMSNAKTPGMFNVGVSSSRESHAHVNTSPHYTKKVIK